jgi:hypothetical protein
MKRITVSIDVSDEHYDQGAEMLESCTKRIIYNYPEIGPVRWLDHSVARPKIVAMRREESAIKKEALWFGLSACRAVQARDTPAELRMSFVRQTTEDYFRRYLVYRTNHSNM